MTVALTHGLLGLEATWTFNGFALNDLDALPYARLDQSTKAMGDFEGGSVPAVGRIGEVPSRAQLRGYTRPFSGTLCAADLPGLRALEAAFLAAASSTADTAMVAAPHPSWGSIALTLFGQPIALSIVEEQTTGKHSWPAPYQRGFVFSFRARDPRAFAMGDEVTAGAGNNSAATLTPGGLAPTEPVWTIEGPADTVLDLQNVTTGRKLRFRDLPLETGDDLIVHFGGVTARRSATISGQDVTGYIDWSASDWWRLDTHGVAPGGASLKSTGAGSWSVTAYPAVW